MAGKKGTKWGVPPEKSPMKWEFYKKHDNNLSQKECEILAKKYRCSLNANCIEYYEKRYPELSHEEHEEILKNKLKEKNKNHPGHLEYYICRYPDLTLEEQKALLEKYSRENCKCCIEYYEKRYPELSQEEHERMSQEYKDILSKNANVMIGEKNPRHKSKVSQKEIREASPKCIEYYEKRYPELSHEEHERMLNEHKDKVKKILQDPTKQNVRIEYWMTKGYSEEEAKNIIQERQKTFSLEKCIEKYGKEKGEKIFRDRQKRWQRSLQENFLRCGDGRSYQSRFANYIIDNICKKLKIKKNPKEKFLSDKNGTTYAYDFCYKNIIIEFNGDYWHMNPMLYKSDDINKTTKSKAADKWAEDDAKKKFAESFGYKYLVIWENEFKVSQKDTIEKCIKFIHDNISN